jgi:hypothetical protein
MSAEYKKYIVLPDNDDGLRFEAFSTLESYQKRRSEIHAWLDKLAKSVHVERYKVEVKDASWSEATIRKDKLFETHCPS